MVNLIVIDSEGIGALDESAEHDARIFSLTILLSSCFIYNSLGSIDENALQNLNLVVSITKNIHLKSKGNDDVDAEEYSQYFPSFLWVVRDFALQLVDEDGEPITSKEYLDNALMPQKGFSEQVENKNRIRRMIASFFKEKDCCTLIRPLMDESRLQTLEQMELDQLRPDFVEQVLMLRKKLMTKARVKSLNGKPLSGSMLVGLLQSYVTSINEGAVPNIENAWTYICKAQCTAALNAAIEEYEEMMRDAISQCWPIPPENLVAVHRDCREQAVRSYKHGAVGDFKENGMEELESKLSDRLASLEVDNKRDFEKILMQTLSAGYAKIEKKLMAGDYKDFIEYERDVRNLQTSFYDNDMSGLNRDGLVAEQLLKKMAEAVHFFLNSIKRDNEAAIAELERHRSRLEKDISTIKEESMKEKNRLSTLISEAESAKSEMAVKLQCVTENLETLKREKEIAEKQMSEAVQEQLNKNKKVIQELNLSVESLKETTQSQERKMVLLTSEFEKEKALMLQKLSFYEISDKNLHEKEQSFHEELSKIKEESNQQMKAMQQKHREAVDKLESELKMLSQRFSDSVDDLKELENEKISLASSFKEREETYKRKIAQLTEKLDDLESDKVSNTKLLRTESEMASEEELKIQMQTLLVKVAQMETEQKIRDEDSKTKRAKLEKEKAVLQQNIEFLETQLSDLRGQIEENKKIHETSIKAFEGSSNIAKFDIAKQLDSLKESHKKEIRQLEGELMATRKRLSDELMDALAQKEEAERSMANQRTEFEAELGSLTEKIAMMTSEREKWLGDSKTAEEAKFRLVKEIEERFKSKQMIVEREIEELKEKNMQEIAEITQKREDDFKRVKQFFEDERTRLETRIVEDKERYEKKVANLIEEYEQKISKDHSDYEEEIENLQETLKEMEIQQLANTQHLENELGMRQQQLEQVVVQLKEAKEQLRYIQSTANINLEQAMKEYSEERKNLETKLDKAKNDLTVKEREIFTHRQTVDTLRADLEKIKEKTEEKIANLTEENKKLTEKLQELTAIYQKVNEEYLENKIDFGKSLALSQQQNEFYSKRIEELQKQVDDSNRRTEDKLRVQREAHQSEVDKLVSQQREERGQMEDKYEAKRRGVKELEAKYQKKLADLDKEKSLLAEKLSATEIELSKLDKKQANEIESLTTQVISLRESLTQEKKLHNTIVEDLNKKAYALELENTEISSAYEKDKALWEGKFTFLTQQRDQYKEDAAEAQKHLEVVVQKWQATRSSDKEEIANNQSTLVAQIEQRYNSQIAEINESHRSVALDLQERINRLERENKSLAEKAQTEGAGRSIATIKALEAKVSDLTNKEQSLNEQLLFYKNDRDQKVIEFQQLLDKEKEAFKKRINEAEMRFKEAENKRNQLMFEHERERTRWNIERDHLNNQKNESLETIYKLEKKSDALIRENEKLKTENRKNKKLTNPILSGMGASNMLNNLNGSKLGDRSFNREQ